MWTNVLVMGLAGFAGTLARYGLGAWVQRHSPVAFPLGTLVVNALGCFLFGLIWALAESRLERAAEMRLYGLIGFLGAFTTFSTFAFDSTQMLLARDWAALGANLLLQNVLGVVCVILGLALGHRI